MYKKILIGLLAGLICGFFSTGGGLILVPGFMYLLNIESKKSRATSTYCILPMAIVGSIFYYTSNFIDWKISILSAIGGLFGGIIGANFLNKIPEMVLKIVFTFFLIYVSYKTIF